MKVRKAIIPVAGLGTRFLPATKSIPKELLPIVDRPTIQYIVEEAVRAGITDICFVISRDKEAIMDHFDAAPQLEETLMRKDKIDELISVTRLSSLAHFNTIRQGMPLGLGHAIAIAESFAGAEPVAVLLGDDVIRNTFPVLAELVAAYNAHEKTIIGVQQVSPETVSRYGIVEPQNGISGTFRIASIVEKPTLESAPSRYAALGRYILTPDIFPLLRSLAPGKGGEIQLTDALNRLAKNDAVYATNMSGTRYDIGNKLGFLQANIDFALARPEFREDLLNWLAEKFDFDPTTVKFDDGCSGCCESCKHNAVNQNEDSIS